MLLIFCPSFPLKKLCEIDSGRPTSLFEKIHRLALRIRRSGDPGGFPLLDLSYGSVIVSDSYSEVSLVLPTPIAYGQGVGALSFANASLNTNFNK